jgi:D-3-phosphoglycerate dehydrogenase
MRPGHVTSDVLDHASNLKIIAVNGSGYDHVDIEAATDRGIIVTHSPEAPAPSVVEHTFSLLFTLIRDLPELYELTEQGKWGAARDHQQYDISEFTVGVVGLGHIGFEFARRTRRCFDAPVVAYDPFVTGKRESKIYPRFDQAEVEAENIEMVGKNELFDRADIVSLHTPLTSETEAMVSTAELKNLEGGYLINTSRGGVIDEPALIKAVRDDQLAGVGLDVLKSEPPDTDNPLLSAESVYVTPHLAGATQRCMDRAAILAAEKVQAVLEGKKPESVINPDVLSQALSS